MEGKLKVAKQEQAPAQPANPQGFYVPAQIMDEILGYIGQGSWFEVNDFINRIRANVQPMFPKTKVNETENQTTPAN